MGNIERVNDFKYLGVLIDHKLRWNKHIDYLRVKLSQAAGVIRKTRSFMPLSASILVYNSLVESFLRYGVVSWGTCANTLKLHLQRIQGRTIDSLNSTRTPYQNNTSDAPITILNLPNIYTHETTKFMHSVAYKYCPLAWAFFK